MNKKAMRNYLIGSLCAFYIVMFLVTTFSSDGEEKHEAKKNEWSTVTTMETLPVPSFTETAETQKVPNPCDVISIEHVNDVVEEPTMRGPIINNVLAPSKACEWTVGDKDYPRLGVSIVLSPSVYDASEATKVEDATIGEKAFVVKGFVTGVGGTSCGRTIIVKEKGYSYSVAVCNEKNKQPTTKQLVKLATDVSNSLP